MTPREVVFGGLSLLLAVLVFMLGAALSDRAAEARSAVKQNEILQNRLDSLERFNQSLLAWTRDHNYQVHRDGSIAQ